MTRRPPARLAPPALPPSPAPWARPRGRPRGTPPAPTPRPQVLGGAAAGGGLPAAAEPPGSDAGAPVPPPAAARAPAGPAPAVPACSTLPIDHPLWAQMAPAVTRDFVWDDVGLLPGKAWPLKYERGPEPPVVPYSLPLEYLGSGDLASYAAFSSYLYPDQWRGPAPAPGPAAPEQPVRLSKWGRAQAEAGATTRSQERQVEEGQARARGLVEALYRSIAAFKSAPAAGAPAPAPADAPRPPARKHTKAYAGAVDVLDKFQRRSRRRGEEMAADGVVA